MSRPLHIQHLLYEPRRGGVSQHVVSVVRCLPALRHSVLLAQGLPGVSEELVSLGAEVHVVPIRSRVLPRSAFGALAARIRRAAADVVHLHNFHTGVFGSLAARLGSARCVVYTPQTLEMRKRALRPAFLAALRLAARRHALWIAVNQAQAEDFRRLAPRGLPVRWVPNAAPPLGPLPDREEARRRLGWPARACVALYAGRLAPEKDPLTFAAAAAEVPEVLWVAAGDGPLRPQLEARARATPQLRPLGFVRDVATLYAAADLLCLPSRWEGLPYAALEALSCGLPLVASRIQGTAELCLEGSTGLGFAPGDAAGLAAAVRRLAGSPELRSELGQAGRQLVTRVYEESAVGARLREAYEEALARSAAGVGR